MEDISQLVIKEFNYWTLLLHGNQCYLGRCVLWCKRGDADEFADMTAEEQSEMFVILKKVKAALDALWSPDRMNYTSLANKTPHLHVHVIPRYMEERRFHGVVFRDTRWGKNPAPYNEDFSLSLEGLESIRSALKTELAKL